MTGIDAALAGIVLLGALWGLFHGALWQLASAALFAATVAVPWAFADQVAHFAQHFWKEPFELTAALAAAALAVAVQIAGTLGLALWRRKWLRRQGAGKSGAPELSLVRAADRALGAVLGAARVAAVLWLLLSILALFESPLRARGFRIEAERSDFYGLAAEHNAVGLVLGKEPELLERVAGVGLSSVGGGQR